jgi:hypothetical protein
MKDKISNFLLGLLEKFWRATNFEIDPLDYCDVYREQGCSHVDGFLCNMEHCEILAEYRGKI